MKIVDKTKDKKEEQWQIVFIKSCSSGATFKTWSTANRAKYLLKDLKEANPEFHKVPSTLILGE